VDIKPNTAVTGPSPDSVRWFEQAYRVNLPVDYVKFLKHGNGGVPVQNVFNVNGRERVLECFLCLMEDPNEDPVNGWRDISVVLSQLDERLIDDEDLVGMNVIPFAVLFGGDFVCFDFRQNPTSPVLAVWDHEQSEEFKPYLEVVADSFSEFLSMLKR